jgi:enoyl-CoA hydratase/carnithine racemase
LDEVPDMPSELQTERRGSTLVLTMSEPATRNLLSGQLFSAGVEALIVAESDPAVRCVVLQGDGGHFCAGLAPAASTERPVDDAAMEMQRVEQFHLFIDALRACPKPVLAAVEGVAAGAGFAVALACDLLVAAEDARFSVSTGASDRSPDGGCGWHLTQALPRPLALQVIWLADPVGARQLLAHGLVNLVCDRGTALAETCALADRLATCSPNMLSRTKALAGQAARATLAEQLALERDQLRASLLRPNGNDRRHT